MTVRGLARVQRGFVAAAVFHGVMPRPSRPAPNQIATGWPPAPPIAASSTPADAALQAAAALARNVVAIRAQRNVSQSWLAGRAGISERSVRKLERGEVWPDVDTAARLAYGLGVELRDLLTD